MSENKCNKYQSLFLFGNEDELQEHVKNCEECKKEHEEMNKISSIIKEVKPYIKTDKKRSKRYKIAACFIVFILGASIINFIKPTNDAVLAEIRQESPAYQMGLPTDEYGLINID